MAIKRCAAGHFFDDSRYSDCPHCGADLSRPGGSTREERVTIALDRNLADELTIGGKSIQDQESTVSVYRSVYNGEPTVGWLVCISGKERGRDYRLHSSRNFVGRSARMDVSLLDDPQVSRENHMSIIFEPNKSEFIALAGENSTLVNGELLTGSVQLHADDVLKVGGTEMVLVPFCTGDRKWDV